MPLPGSGSGELAVVRDTLPIRAQLRHQLLGRDCHRGRIDRGISVCFHVVSPPFQFKIEPHARNRQLIEREAASICALSSCLSSPARMNRVKNA
jgi:hypothetical protein